MAAWIDAWSQCISDATSPTRSSPATATTAPVPIDVRAQLATLLAGIILGLPQEATT